MESHSTIEQVAHIFTVNKLFSQHLQEDAEHVQQRQPASILEVDNLSHILQVPGPVKMPGIGLKTFRFLTRPNDIKHNPSGKRL